jgi:hypothetical protein
MFGFSRISVIKMCSPSFAFDKIFSDVYRRHVPSLFNHQLYNESISDYIHNTVTMPYLFRALSDL